MAFFFLFCVLYFPLSSFSFLRGQKQNFFLTTQALFPSACWLVSRSSRFFPPCFFSVFYPFFPNKTDAFPPPGIRPEHAMFPSIFTLTYFQPTQTTLLSSTNHFLLSSKNPPFPRAFPPPFDPPTSRHFFTPSPIALFPSKSAIFLPRNFSLKSYFEGMATSARAPLLP